MTQATLSMLPKEEKTQNSHNYYKSSHLYQSTKTNYSIVAVSSSINRPNS